MHQPRAIADRGFVFHGPFVIAAERRGGGDATREHVIKCRSTADHIMQWVAMTTTNIRSDLALSSQMSAVGQRDSDCVVNADNKV